MLVKEIKNEVSCGSDKFIVIHMDGREETHKHTDIDGVISSLECRGISEVLDVFDI